MILLTKERKPARNIRVATLKAVSFAAGNNSRMTNWNLPSKPNPVRTKDPSKVVRFIIQPKASYELTESITGTSEYGCAFSLKSSTVNSRSNGFQGAMVPIIVICYEHISVIANI